MSCKYRRLYVLSSPSGGGKSTIIRELLSSDPDLQYAISATTRAPRHEENEGKDYFFLNKEDFQKRIEENAFLEWASVHGQFYGTLRTQIENCLTNDKDVILDVDVQGGYTIKKGMPEATLIFLIPPSFGVLEERLRGRKTENEEVLVRRLNTARKEMECVDRYDFVVINNRLEDAVKEILVIIENGRNHHPTGS